MLTSSHLYLCSLKNGVLWIAVLMLFAASASAAGYGGYLGYAHSDGSVDFFGVDVDHDNDMVDFGFVLDTNLARDRLFNFRLNVGLQIGERTYKGPGGSFPEETVGFTVNSAFGFGIVRTPTLRLWLGPAIRVSVDGCTDCSGYDSTFVAVGAGPELGLNFNIGDHLTISPTLGYQYMYGADVLDGGGVDEIFDGGQHHVSLLFSIMFRTGSDSFPEP
jgi:hypothetical protein